MEQERQKEQKILKNLTRQWIEGWKTSSSQPFTIDPVSHLYKHDDRLSSYDFGGTTEGVLGWQQFVATYTQFMGLTESWTLTLTNEIRVELRNNFAWTTASLYGKGGMKDGQKVEFPGRVTLIWEQTEDGWLIVHEHGSSPVRNY
ncbi:MAG: nuclear transport factor 2 family protein [Cyanobacteria bacterium P01_G01_bin.67]